MKKIAVNKIGLVKVRGFLNFTTGLSKDIDDYIRHRYGDLGWGINLDVVHSNMTKRLSLLFPFSSTDPLTNWPHIEEMIVRNGTVTIVGSKKG